MEMATAEAAMPAEPVEPAEPAVSAEATTTAQVVAEQVVVVAPLAEQDGCAAAGADPGAEPGAEPRAAPGEGLAGEIRDVAEVGSAGTTGEARPAATEAPTPTPTAAPGIDSPAALDHPSASASGALSPKLKVKLKAAGPERAGPEAAKSGGSRAAWAAAAAAGGSSESSEHFSGKELETVESVTEKWTLIVEEKRSSFKKSDVDGKLRKWQQRAMYGQEGRGGGLELSESFKAWYVAQRDRHRVELPEPVQAVIAEEATAILKLVKERYMRVLGPEDELVIKTERRLQELRNRVEISDDNLVPLDHADPARPSREPSLFGRRPSVG